MKARILQKLRENISEYISGEKLSEELRVSRTAVWKYIRELKKEGYEIESSSKKGYRLVCVPDILSREEIGYGLNTKKIGKDILYFDVIDSTNNYAKKIASDGCEEGTVVVADRQTSGRGRLGREWNSLEKAGIWMSVILRPTIAPEDVQVITLAASVAVVSAIKEVTGIQAGIKWPNDIVLGGKKVCGILTEMNSEMERVNFIVLGIGINVNQLTDHFPPELRDIAISLKAFACEENIEAVFRRSDIIKSILSHLERVYYKINMDCTVDIINEWRKYSVTIGKEIKVIIKDRQYIGIAENITDDGKLVVNCMDGVKREVLSGEISVRGILGYV